MANGLIIGTLCLAVHSSQAPPTIQPAPTIGTAVIRGQITDMETGAPLPRAMVTARSTTQPDFVRQNLADHDGRFEFVSLPRGRYEVSATAGEYRATHLREVFRDRPLPSGVAPPMLTLGDGEVRSEVDIALPRTLAISGRVVDEFGDPVAGVGLRVTPVRGSRLPAFSAMRSSDDRGLFRLFGVAPGQYLVSADTQFTPNVRGAGAPRTERFVTTFYPSALNESDAQAVSVTVGDVDGIEIRMRRSRAFSISGTIVDSSGAPAQNPLVSIVHYTGGGTSSTGTTASDGHFLFAGLLPGEYAVEARIHGADGSVQQQGSVPVPIQQDDVEGLVVALTLPATVRGRIVFEDAPPASREGGPIVVSARSASRQRSGPGAPPSPVDADYSFRLTNLFGRQRIDVQGLPRGWVVKSIRYRGEDITQSAADFTTDPRQSIEIVATSRVAVVTGVVTDDNGKPASARVMLLPADPRRWTEMFSHQYPMAPAARDGRFTLPGVPAGDYVIVATGSSDVLRALDTRRLTLEALAKHGERISLVDNDRLTMTLRLVALPDGR